MSTNETVSFDRWHKNQPDNHNGNEDCVELGGSEEKTYQLWNDWPCGLEARFICEVKIFSNDLF